MGYTAVKDPRVRELFEDNTGKIRSAFEPFLADDTDFGRQEAKKLSVVEYDWIKQQDPHYGLFGIFDGDTLCGTADVTYDEDLNLAWLRDVYILPAYRHRGYGKALVEAALAKYPDKKWHYQAARDNAPSIALAKSLGFTLEGAGLFIV
ncbi:MAG: GNAT family N-acetyltransferase [Clostridia bacterium]|nr:GNAT family N-acetyltransferase [Clostridia bacterium]